jgi:hypothetical protein
MKRRSVLALALLLAGCGGKVIEDNYAGPTAILRDSYANFRKGGVFTPDSVQVFAVSHVDGKFVENGSLKTGYASVGSVYGLGLKPKSFERRVPVKTMKVRIMGVIHYTGPKEPSTRVQREVTFHPAAGQTYIVRGNMDESSSEASVWIETANGKRVTE